MSMILHTVRMTGNMFLRTFNPNYTCERNFFSINTIITWVTAIFNAVDRERITLVGPDFACAEWLLRNGGSVRFKGQAKFVTDYNALIALEESPQGKGLKMQEIFAEKADLTNPGFDHIKDCEHINKITLIKCTRVGDYALAKFRFISESLQHLEIKSSPSITDKGILYLVNLKNLNKLILTDLPSVKNKKDCEMKLKNELPKCDIQFQE